MVVPIGNIANKFFFSTTFSSSIMSNSQEFVLPTMLPTKCMGMDIPTGFVPVNSFEVRERTSFTDKNLSRDTSMSSTCSSIIYHERMANNGMDIDPEPLAKSPALSHETKQEKVTRLGKAAKTLGNTRPQNGTNEASLIQLERVGHTTQGE